MNRKEKIEALRDLFCLNRDIDTIAKDIQAVDPNKFRVIISTMIKQNDISEDNFHRLNKSLPTESKDALIDELDDYYNNGNIEIEENGDIVVENITDTLKMVSEYEKAIYGTCLMDLMGINNEFVEYTLEEMGEEEYASDPDVLSEEEKEDAITLINGYTLNKDCTCLYSIFTLLLNNPNLINYIPYDHITKLGIHDLFKEPEVEKEEMLTIMSYLETLPITYLAYSSDYHYSKGLLTETVDRIRNELTELVVAYTQMTSRGIYS